ncbi:MAG: Ig-like domain-containing protein [Clostridia bacterium]|nr:Ig-like domain-containing protein [Clostridia bacterium]
MKKQKLIVSAMLAVLLIGIMGITGFEVFAVDVADEIETAFEFFTCSDSSPNANHPDAEIVEKLSIVHDYAILEGSTQQMTVEENVPIGSVEWSSSDESVISCNPNGEIKGLKKGKATITVKAKKGRAKDSITVYCAKKLNNEVHSYIDWYIAWSCRTPMFFNIQSMHFNVYPLFRSEKLNVKGIYGSFFYITFERDGKMLESFIYKNWMPEKIASDEIFRQISVDEVVLLVGESSAEKLMTNYKGTVKWNVSDKSVVSFDSSTGKITAKKPGTAIITATVGTKTLGCTVFSVSNWYEPETAVAAKQISVRQVPNIKGKTVATLPKGTSMTAKGDLENGQGWIYIISETAKGFIRISDFPGIDYLMSEYHYYDQGFDVRYDSAVSKIYDYASVLNDVMMANFNLKICPYVESYTSTADQCKIWSYGSVYKSNLFADCAKMGYHYQDSCLWHVNMREKMLLDKGKGSDVVGKCLWTGHILEGHVPSVTNSPLEAIVFTCRNVTAYSSTTGQYKNISDAEIRTKRIVEIVHETAHLLGAQDGYCFGVLEGEERCSNKYCYECNKLPIPKCIMAQEVNPETEKDVFCEECIETIKTHIAAHH